MLPYTRRLPLLGLLLLILPLTLLLLTSNRLLRPHNAQAYLPPAQPTSLPPGYPGPSLPRCPAPPPPTQA
ncbi:MAG: hypothetical protein H6988_09185 [Pseudomonadales bacterium]|nr:hypothetical protein [Pseudomonadales bacterium]